MIWFSRLEFPAEGSSTASPVKSTKGLMEIQKNRKIAMKRAVPTRAVDPLVRSAFA
ncbi:hypothetical protein [Sinorhizobium medicae]